MKKLTIIISLILASQGTKSQTLTPDQNRKDSIETIQKVEIQKIEKVDEQFSEENLVKYMEELGIQYIPFSVAQAIHESANFKSKRFREDNNMFGMKKATQRRTTAIGSRNGYAVYSSWKQSVEDFYLMQQGIVKRHKTESAYMSYIARNYAADPKYMSKVRKYVKIRNETRKS